MKDTFKINIQTSPGALSFTCVSSLSVFIPEIPFLHALIRIQFEDNCEKTKETNGQLEGAGVAPSFAAAYGKALQVCEDMKYTRYCKLYNR